MIPSFSHSDEEVIKQILAGTPALFEILIRRYNPYLYKTGRAYHYNHEDTQDLMQDTFVDAYTHLRQFENRSSFKTWILRIMLNNCYRKRHRLRGKMEVTEASQPEYFVENKQALQTDANQIIMQKELKFIIENALLKIPLPYRMVFTLREMNGLSIKETAEAVEISEANVKVRLNRAKVMMRKEVEKAYSVEELFDFNLKYCDLIVHRVMEKIHALNRIS